MNFADRTTHFLSFFLLTLCALLGFGLADLGAVGLAAMAVSLREVGAIAFAFTLLAGGTLLTVWHFERR